MMYYFVKDKMFNKQLHRAEEGFGSHILETQIKPRSRHYKLLDLHTLM
jgi:hypothetical protein